MIGVYHKKSWDRQTNRISISGAEWKGADPRFFLGGFSPVWVIVCCLRSPAWVNNLLQLLHLCGFSPVWMSMCVFKFSARTNDLSHPEQLSFLSTVGESMCPQISGLAEWFVASGTIELLFSTVCQQMLLQIESVTEWFATLVTSVLWILHYTANYFNYNGTSSLIIKSFSQSFIIQLTSSISGDSFYHMNLLNLQ